MKSFNSWFVAGGAVLALGLATQTAMAAEQKSVNEKILDILLEQGTIDQERYDALMEEVEAEKRAAALPAVSAAQESDPEGWKVYWNDGSRIERNDGRYKIKFGGRIQLDAAASHLSDTLDDVNPDGEGTGVDFRRARFFMEGAFAEHGIFKAEYDFAGSDADFKDVFVGLRSIPFLGTVRVGHIKEPQSIEMATSSKYMMFMERSLPVLAFTAERNTGIGFHNQLFDERMTVHAGAFRAVGDTGESFSNQGDYNVGFRVTGLPIWEDEGGRVLHTGLWYSHEFGHDEELEYDPIPEANTVGPLIGFVDDDDLNLADPLDANGIDLVGAELAWIFGPFSAQGEFITSFVDGAGATSDSTFYGSYLAASYFLTGERRVYDTEFGAIGRTKPSEPFSLSKGEWGALEVAGRWSYLSLTDDSSRGGILNDFTLGLNWYLYSNLRIMTNYVYARRNGGGEAHIAQSRVALDF